MKIKKLIQNFLGTELEKIHTLAIGKATSVDNEKMICTIEVLQYFSFRGELHEVPKVFNVPLTQPLWGGRYVIKAPFQEEDKFIIGFTEVDSYAAVSGNNVRKQETRRRYSLDDTIILGYLPKNGFDRVKEFQNDLLLIDRQTGYHIRIGDEGINTKGPFNHQGSMVVNGPLGVTEDITAGGTVTCKDVITEKGSYNGLWDAYYNHLKSMH
ncbi:hypothetical protein PM10SUCC1_32290 [Propionigenium maris DSM 9537]|uniref:Phage protein Gp138 N-terminal domain-containing protein n=1 Tax=Propionigenium maris DSM 9537 TaxID=1123000 RepID=A0A9W6GP31_9FUSO|nr:hypothetical protein [Propionigenium maris]GLI57715.1 hypothetical protein PM10SUCC1_32290 [Propionigenium maris DSM 9537]